MNPNKLIEDFSNLNIRNQSFKVYVCQTFSVDTLISSLEHGDFALIFNIGLHAFLIWFEVEHPDIIDSLPGLLGSLMIEKLPHDLCIYINE